MGLCYTPLSPCDKILPSEVQGYAGVPLTEESQQERYGDQPKYQVSSTLYPTSHNPMKQCKQDTIQARALNAQSSRFTYILITISAYLHQHGLDLL
jgi:hypothetical protein